MSGLAADKTVELSGTYSGSFVVYGAGRGGSTLVDLTTPTAITFAGNVFPTSTAGQIALKSNIKTRIGY